MIITRRAGDNLDKNGQLQGDLTTWFTDVAGSGQAICKIMGDLGSNEVGTYRWSMAIDFLRANICSLKSCNISEWTDTNEKLALFQDDLGGYKVYSYPDADLKATASGVTVNSIPDS